MVKICIKNTRASFKNYSKMIHKSFKQLNAERAARRASFLIRYNLGLCEKKKKINKASSARAGGPSPEESGFKPASLTVYKL